jgi:hypothetical protein
MSDGLAEHCGINRGAPSRTGVPADMAVGTKPELKREMRRHRSDMRITPNGLVRMPLGQVATLTYLQVKPVPEGSRGRNAASNLANLEKRMPETESFAPASDTIQSIVALLARLIDGWFQKA